ncbi:hypothetical protein PAMC26510_35940 [Caballeronia sordidicola]|uniref:Uncharacterized protein n=1 Tax=Caballeronia sordidicola TaxID=196367 RepID=A0A242M678_CABSO|nr:hypothetical protein PAMC26510_35940 [Caballeronia sordidicola]
MTTCCARVWKIVPTLACALRQRLYRLALNQGISPTIR